MLCPDITSIFKSYKQWPTVRFVSGRRRGGCPAGVGAGGAGPWPSIQSQCSQNGGEEERQRGAGATGDSFTFSFLVSLPWTLFSFVNWTLWQNTLRFYVNTFSSLLHPPILASIDDSRLNLLLQFCQMVKTKSFWKMKTSNLRDFVQGRKLQPEGHIQPAACFSKSRFLEHDQAHLLVYCL